MLEQTDHHPPERVVPIPAVWELEWRIVEIACDLGDLDRSQVTASWRLLEDLNWDSLAAVEFVMAVEEAFDIEISDAEAESIFVDQATLATVGRWVHERLSGPIIGHPKARHLPVSSVPGPQVPFTQLGGCLDSEQWLERQLYGAMGANREGWLQYRRRTDGMRCVLIPEAEVWIGSADPDALPEQRPIHQTRLRPFLLDAEPVSNTAFARFLNSVGEMPAAVLAEWCGVGGSDPRREQFPLRRSRAGWEPLPGTERQPMILVSWYGANAYALWANRRDWRTYRTDGSVLPDLRAGRGAPRVESHGLLPTEAQWEYAARGPQAATHPCADPAAGADVAWETAVVERHAAGASYTSGTIPAVPVCARQGVSPFGLHHMAGNVWHWCRDWYAPDFYGRPEAGQPDPQNGRATGIRSERGGSWVGPRRLACPSYRRGRPAAMRGRCLGFRCAGLVEDLP
jgi:sulfatase modifying factor 1